MGLREDEIFAGAGSSSLIAEFRGVSREKKFSNFFSDFIAGRKFLQISVNVFDHVASHLLQFKAMVRYDFVRQLGRAKHVMLDEINLTE